ncbi:MAG TPA: LuxR family transcriptional regulator [Novimethylophilus sp.]|uniref:helix-turn-helix transcriptional regulator n=1 Tax=Novimethylophilus sp. TaxID=2137426 RepID=UPI002F407080
MVQIESLYGLLNCATEDAWSKALFSLARRHGFEQTVYGVVPNKQTPLENAFLRSNYSSRWRSKYDSEKLHYVDPTVGHCLNSTLPLIWQPQTFKAPQQRELYEEACGYGIRSGITYPVHGANGEFGVISFVSDTLADKKFQRELGRFMPELALIRDYVFESSLRFATPSAPQENSIHLTRRELESLKWAMVGKSSWEISQIMRCSEATVNFHVGNVRRKFKVATRQQAVVKAIRLGLISPV